MRVRRGRDGASWVNLSCVRVLWGSVNVSYRRLVREDAERLTIPFICLFSKEDGTPELMKEYQEALEKKGGNVVETYGTMRHGWMGARADFENEASVKEYERG